MTILKNVATTMQHILNNGGCPRGATVPLRDTRFYRQLFSCRHAQHLPSSYLVIYLVPFSWQLILEKYSKIRHIWPSGKATWGYPHKLYTVRKMFSRATFASQIVDRAGFTYVEAPWPVSWWRPLSLPLLSPPLPSLPSPALPSPLRSRPLNPARGSGGAL